MIGFVNRSIQILFRSEQSNDNGEDDHGGQWQALTESASVTTVERRFPLYSPVRVSRKLQDWRYRFRTALVQLAPAHDGDGLTERRCTSVMEVRCSHLDIAEAWNTKDRPTTVGQRQFSPQGQKVWVALRPWASKHPEDLKHVSPTFGALWHETQPYSTKTLKPVPFGRFKRTLFPPQKPIEGRIRVASDHLEGDQRIKHRFLSGRRAVNLPKGTEIPPSRVRRDRSVGQFAAISPLSSSTASFCTVSDVYLPRHPSR